MCVYGASLVPDHSRNDGWGEVLACQRIQGLSRGKSQTGTAVGPTTQVSCVTLGQSLLLWSEFPRLQNEGDRRKMLGHTRHTLP